MPVRAPLLTLRELNRALLARQMLLERRRLGVVEAIERLGCLQGQWAPAPYVSLWSRLAEFDRERLTHAIDKREVVKSDPHARDAAPRKRTRIPRVRGRDGRRALQCLAAPRQPRDARARDPAEERPR